MKFRLGVVVALVASTVVCSNAGAMTLTVTSAADTPGTCPGPGCTLRAAIQAVDSSSDPSNEIGFAGPLTVFYTSSDLAVTRPVTITGCDQCGIDGSLAGIDATGLLFDAGSAGSAVHNLDIVNFQGAAIQVQRGADVTVTGSILGLGRKGNSEPNVWGVLVTPGSSAVVGGPTSGDRNVISANTVAGIEFNGTSLTARGNYIGTSLDGTRAAGNGLGVDVMAPGATIGGPAAGDGNVISGSAGATASADGVLVGDGAAGTVIENNRIGTDAAGTAALPNGGNGIETSAARTGIAEDLISGNAGDGVLIHPGATQSFIDDGMIGTDAAGSPLGNGGDGVRADSTRTDVQAEWIANNRAGVVVGESAGDVGAVGNNIQESRIKGNGREIDLGNDGTTANHAASPTAGPNQFQNFPGLSAVAITGGRVLAVGTLHSTPERGFRIDWYAAARCDASGHGPADIFLGETTIHTDVRGVAPVGASLPDTAPVGVTVPPGWVITTTATDLTTHSTSELSACRAAMSRLPPALISIPTLRGFMAARKPTFAGTAGGCVPIVRVDVAVAQRGHAVRFLRAAGTTRWHLRWPHRLPAGHYWLYVRITDLLHRQATLRRAFSVKPSTQV